VDNEHQLGSYKSLLDRAVNYPHGTKRIAAMLFATTEALPIFEIRHEMRAAIAFPNWGYRFGTHRS
jgi:hypothetical protein